MASPTNNWLSPILVTSSTIGLTTTTTTRYNSGQSHEYQLSPSRVTSEGVLLEEYIGKVRFVTPIVVFIAFLEQALREQQFWCENCKKIPNIEGENKYLVFVSYHLARAENGWRKNSQATKWIQVASTSLRIYCIKYLYY